ncbi:hemolysin family protein [Bacteroidota bacterium]
MGNDQLPYIISSLIFSACFSGVEIAFVASDKLQIELDNEKGKLYGKIFSRFIKNPSQFIGTTLLGNTLALVVYGIYMADLIEPVLSVNLPQAINGQTTILILQTIIATSIVLLTAEFLPKSLFLINPNFFLSLFSVPLYIIYWLLYPAVALIVKMSKFIIIKVLHLDFQEDKPVFGLTDLNEFIQSRFTEVNEKAPIDVDTKIFSNALEFKTIKIRDCMIPRTDIRAVDINDDISELREEFINSGYSKILVFKNSIDDIIGYCHSSELYKKPKDITDILTPIIIVPETMLANELLIQFINDRKSMALVVDEFGGTSGIVTMEDIIEEIFGEIEDEHDEQALIEQHVDENTYLFSARHEIDYLNERYKLNLPSGEYDTLGGFILSVTEELPKINENIEISHYKFHVVSMEENRIDLVRLTI